ncbi:cytochrome b/b6 domain-containing protein [Paraburkholderia sp. LEh10]|uniref:cytochrome b/b6 domain-containing protein n=1 Tax=Paraburkholderia sp. LEh10 TaxID=2821353 RepID=UPI001AEAB320|nr:cytochrome b/b6 domain-containing protein [Paraburkholderia sp. LEh10]MBP0593394.1 cytochrome b/b6 domain-containing protein [Paraburkholderia sp. LEh10]
MNTSSAYRNSSSAGDTAVRRILVWDAPVRIFHWLFAACFAGAWLTAESENWRLVHVALGYTAGGLVIFRLVWGLVGTKYARFSSFVRGPAYVGRYLLGILRGHPQRHVGHNPAGAVVIVAMLALACALTMTGWATYNDIGGNWLDELHEGLASVMLALIGIHVTGVVVSSWLHRENLVGAMLSGHKSGRPDEGIKRAWRSVAAIVLASVLAFWWWQWQVAPAPMMPDRGAATSHQTAREDAD